MAKKRGYFTTSFSSPIKGAKSIEDVLEAMKGAMAGMGVEISLKDTVGSDRPIKMGRVRRPKEGGPKFFFFQSKRHESRSASQNAKIINKQAKEGRNPLFIHPKDVAKIVKKIESFIPVWTKKRYSIAILKHFQANIAPMILEAIKRNIKLERHSNNGSSFSKMKPIDSKYAAAKQRFIGNKPIMQKTSNVIKGFVAKARKLK